jgi:hypothetical protein
MKKVLTPSTKEEAVYYSDISGTCFGNLGPHVQIKFEFNYGSSNDQNDFELHVTDKEFIDIFNSIKKHLKPDTFTQLKKLLKDI